VDRASDNWIWWALGIGVGSFLVLQMLNDGSPTTQQGSKPVPLDSDLWERAKAEAVAASKAGRWSARAAQDAVNRYKRAGGQYAGSRESGSLYEWRQEEWVSLDPKTGSIIGPCGTPTGQPASRPTRCLPRARAEGMTPAQRRQTARRKARAGAGQNIPV
jgi:hypothetical protein